MQLKITKIFQTKNCPYIKESIKVKKRFAGKKDRDFNVNSPL